MGSGAGLMDRAGSVSKQTIIAFDNRITIGYFTYLVDGLSMALGPVQRETILPGDGFKHPVPRRCSFGFPRSGRKAVQPIALGVAEVPR